MLLIVISYLVLVFLVPIALSALVGYRALPVGRGCPQCGAETLPIRVRHWHYLSAIHPRAFFQHRWCYGCGWEGAVRLPRDRAARERSIRRAGTKATPSTHTLDVRSLDIDGAPWRVMLQCWGRNDGAYQGRLVFVGPSGRLWLDAVQPFGSTSQRELLGQALALPDGLLVTRLRRLVAGA